jgi:hypothetical protein
MKKLILLIFICLLLGCKTSEKNNAISLENFVIKNEFLLSNIKDYYKKIISKEAGECIMTLDISQKEYTSVFIISYEKNIFNFNPPLMYLKINNFDIAVTSNISQFLGVSNESHKKLLNKNLPTEFLKYKLSNEPPPPITYRNEVWILKFKGNILVSKIIK